MELFPSAKGLSQIIERVWSVYNIRLPPTTAYGWITKRHTLYNGIRLLSLKPSKELAYIIGAVVGDGYVYRYQRHEKHSTEFRIGIHVKDVDFASEFSRCLSEVLKRRPPNPFPTVHGLFTVQVQSKTLYELLKNLLIGDESENPSNTATNVNKHSSEVYLTVKAG
ncbi:MAG: hypothetical protein QXF45_07480 [Candidatus Caldarchaeum sp.]